MTWGGHGGGDDFEASLDVDYDFTADVDVEFDTDVDYDSDTNVDVDICVDVDIDGNSAVFNIDVQAAGDDSATELNLVVFVNEDYSSITASGFAAVD